MFRDVLELYVSLRILKAAAPFLVVGAYLIFPMWFMVDVGVILLWSLVALVPLSVIWALVVVWTNVRRFYR